MEIFEALNQIAPTSETFKNLTFFKNLFNKMWSKDIIETKLFSENDLKKLDIFLGNKLTVDTFIQDMKYNMNLAY
jgi:hypothetical protein